MANFAMTWLLTMNGVTRKSQKTVTASDPGSQNYGPIVIANGATNQQLSIGGIDISQLVGVWIQSTEDVLIEFNNSSGIGGSIALEAGIPYVWLTGDVNALLITADVTAVFVTNASGSAATLHLSFLQDITP